MSRTKKPRHKPYTPKPVMWLGEKLVLRSAQIAQTQRREMLAALRTLHSRIDSGNVYREVPPQQG